MSSEQISLLIALVAVIFGPLIQLYIAKAQIKAEVLSGNRQQWINELRNEIATYMNALTMLHVDIIRKGDDSKKIEYIDKLSTHRQRIYLLVNPKEHDHQQLLEKLGLITKFVLKGKDGENEKAPATKDWFEELENDITAVSQNILKREWERVKSGD